MDPAATRATIRYLPAIVCPMIRSTSSLRAPATAVLMATSRKQRQLDCNVRATATYAENCKRVRSGPAPLRHGDAFSRSETTRGSELLAQRGGNATGVLEATAR